MKVAIKSISLRDDLWREFLKQAENEERSASAIIRQLIRGYLDKMKKKGG